MTFNKSEDVTEVIGASFDGTFPASVKSSLNRAFKLGWIALV